MEALEIAELRKHTTSIEQVQLLDLLERGMSTAQAAKQLGKAERNARKAIEKMRSNRQKAAFELDSGRIVEPPKPRFIKATSELYDAQTGEQKLVWVKTDTDKEQRIEQIQQGVIDALEDFKGAAGAVKAPTVASKDTLHMIPIGDPHIGLYAWAAECGDDFDVDIARNDLLSGVQMILASVPSCDECIVVNLGDFFHADTSENRTMRSGHALDVDSRYARVTRLGMRLMVDVINEARKKHKRVRVISLAGNHDDHSGRMMATALDLLFANDKRVTVDTSPSPYVYYRYGQNLFGFTHGDKCKPNILGELMAADRKQDWGDTTYRYWHTGHIHTNNSMDCRGWRWESHRTLAAQDAWSSGAGYRSGRDIKGILYHREYGEVNRSTMDIRAIRGRK